MQNDHFILKTNSRPPITMVRGEGAYLWDSSGRRYVDMVQGWATNNLGHAPPVINEALRRQSACLWNASPAFHTEVQQAASKALGEATGYDQVFFTTSGAEANEGAIKLARKFGQRRRGGAYENHRTSAIAFMTEPWPPWRCPAKRPSAGSFVLNPRDFSTFP